MPSIVITGASGFCGQAILGQLYGQNLAVQGIARKSMFAREGVLLTCVDDYAETPVAVGTTLLHMAEAADARAYDDRAGAGRQLATLQALLEKPWQRFVYVSSVAVYGDGSRTPLRPGEATNPVTAYGRYKLAAESLVLEAGGVVARPSNLYGPGMAANNVLSDILAQMKESDRVTVRDRLPVRDYLWIDDFAEGLAKLVLS